MTDVDGRRLRAEWDTACDTAAAATRRAMQIARDRDEVHVASYLAKQLAGLRGVRATAGGRRAVPGSEGSGLLFDMPPELAEPHYAPALDALENVRRLWRGALGGGEWDWSRGYPPGWPTSWRDRLGAGVFYRAK